jgi:uncharacterized phage-associated protein
MAKYEPSSIANGFLELGFRDSVSVDPMKIQKLTYFANGYYLAKTGEPLVNERFQAWKLGPVLPTLYHEMKRFRGMPIDSYAKIYDRVLNRIIPAAPPEDDAEFVKIRQFVWMNYGKRESITLSRLTHKVGGAWQQTILDNPGIEGPQIPDDLIRKEFAPLVSNPVSKELA